MEMKYLPAAIQGFAIGTALGALLLSGWLGRIAGAAAVLVNSLPPH